MTFFLGQREYTSTFKELFKTVQFDTIFALHFFADISVSQISFNLGK
jgi:hypothetical protein